MGPYLGKWKSSFAPSCGQSNLIVYYNAQGLSTPAILRGVDQRYPCCGRHLRVRPFTGLHRLNTPCRLIDPGWPCHHVRIDNGEGGTTSW